MTQRDARRAAERDAAEELLDVLDASGRPIGVKSRAAVHRDGDWHQVFHCLIVAGRATGPAAILQLRGAAAKAFPNLLDVTVGGHLLAGESPLGGMRELREELGIDVVADALVPLGTRHSVIASGEGALDCELIHVFLLRDDRHPEAYPIQPNEVGGLLEIPIADLLTVFDSPKALVEGHGIVVDLNGAFRATDRRLSAADLVPNPPYWVTLLIMAERFGLGRRPLSI
jgi:isopentenyldiphosphate isomerase